MSTKLGEDRTDVYALGVMLYEMLTGRRPYETATTSLIDAVRLICEEAPRSLRQTWRGVRKLDLDIETIVGKALETEADRRYASAAALSEDITRWLTSQPILARPPSTLYQLRKFARRNKVLVGGVAAVFMALAVGAVVSSWQAVRATRAESEARHEAATADRVSEFLVGLFEVVDPGESRGNTVTAREILDRGAQEIDQGLADQPEVLARLMGTMGRVYYQLGLYPQAAPLLERSLETGRRELGNDHPTTLAIMSSLAKLYYEVSRNAESEQLHLETIERQRRVLGNEHRRAESACWAKGIRIPWCPFTTWQASPSAGATGRPRSTDSVRQSIAVCSRSTRPRDPAFASLQGDPEFEALAERARQNAAARRAE